MTATRNRSKRSLAFVTALATLFALVIPFMATPAQAADNDFNLEVSADIDSNPTGTVHTLTARILNSETTVDAADLNAVVQEIDFEIESGPAARVNCVVQPDDSTCTGGTSSDDGNTPNTPDLSCVTAGGTCSVRFTSDAQGTNVVRAWVDDDSNNTTTDADTTEGRYAGGNDCLTASVDDDPNAGVTGACNAGTATPGDRTDSASLRDDTDVVSKAWSQSVAAACLDAEPETDTNASGTEHTVTAKATSSAAGIADANGTFECTGAALANTTVDITVAGDDTPDIFIKSVNGTATGGPVAGGPNTASGTTTAAGQIDVVIQCVSAGACTGTNSSIVLSVQGAVSGSSADTVAKTWTPAGTSTTLDATPETDTNEIGQTHTVTCAVLDAFGAGVAAQNCDAQVTSGPNADNNIGTDGNVTNGYIGQCTTGADGTCTVSYSSSETGTDAINVFRDADGNDVDTGGPGDGTEIDDQISKTWVAVGAGVADVDIDMKNSDAAEADCDNLADGTDDAADDSTATNQVSPTVGHEICAEQYNASGARLAGPITFTLTGVGTLFDDVDEDGVFDTAEADLGTSATVQENGTGFNRIGVSSTEAGTSTVTACAQDGTTCATGTKTWTNEDARTFTLECDEEAPVGAEAECVGEALDRYGNAAAGATIAWSEIGPAVFTGQENTTDANGQVQATLSANSTGTSDVTATITNDGNGNTTECTAAANSGDEGAGTESGTPAGNCSATDSVAWVEEVQPECSDGVDNDGDGAIDFPADAGCTSGTDTTENTDEDRDESRTISIRKHFKGTVSSASAGCVNNELVKLYRKKKGASRFRVVGKDRTNDNGNWSIFKSKGNKKSRWFARVTKSTFTNETAGTTTCLKAQSPTVRKR